MSTISTNSTNSQDGGLPTTRPPSTTTTWTKRLLLVDQEPRPDAEGLGQRTHKANDNRKKKRRRATDREEEQAQATAPSTTPGIYGGSDGTDHHRAEGAAGALAEPDSAAGSPIGVLPLEMVHAVLAQVDDLDLPACLFVCHDWRDAVADRARRTWRRRQHLLSERLAAEGRLAALQWARSTLDIPWGRKTCSEAARRGHLDLLRWVRAQGCPWDENTCSQAARGGHLDLLKWARAQGCPWDVKTCQKAARGGHLLLMEWARAQGCPWDKQLSWTAVASGRLDVLDWMTTQGYPWDLECMWTAAAWTGRREVIQWSLARGLGSWQPTPPGALRLTQAAALQGHLEMLQWLRERGCPWDERTCAAAACGGHLALLRWARANGCPWDDRTCVQAAQEGHLEVLRWAHANGCPWDERTCLVAAAYGQLEALHWARSNGCPWDEDACRMAAAHGHLATLQWAMHSGCPHTHQNLYHNAEAWGRGGVMAWLEEDARTKGHDLQVRGPCANIDDLADDEGIMTDTVKDLWQARQWAPGVVRPRM